MLSAPLSPWQSAYIERVIGSIRVSGPRDRGSPHRHIRSFVDYYHESFSPEKDTPGIDRCSCLSLGQ